MRGYFGIGVERLTKPVNAGNLFRSAHAFGASFIFTIAARYARSRASSDTSEAPAQMPFYEFPTVEAMQLPDGCQLVGVEFTDDAVELPTFRHPSQAAYVLGPEKGSLSPELLARCDHVVRIPTGFCLNVATAGAIVMYDRLTSLGRFGRRAVFSHQRVEPPAPHVQGAQIFRRPQD